MGFRAIWLTFDLDSSEPDEDLDEPVATTERDGVVLQTLAASPHLEVTRS